MINSTLYIFGDLGGGYTQYPFDYTKNFLSTLFQRVEGKSILAIHRDNNLMYYCYLRKLDNNQHIGFCLLLNSVMFSNIKGLFPVFENTLTFMVTSGEIVGFNTEGEIVAKTNSFLGKEKDIDTSLSYIQSELSKFESCLKKLPPVSYATSKTETKTFDITDEETKIVEASCKYCFTFVVKDTESISAKLSGYKSVITKLNKEKEELVNKNEELNGKYQKMIRQKKQFKYVVFLLIIVIGCCVGIFSLNDNLNVAQSQLTDANNSIVQKNEKIKAQKGVIADMTNKYNNTVQQRDALEKELYDYRDLISDYQPFLFKSSSFNFNTNEYSFDYYGLKEGYQPITVRVIYPNGDVKTFDHATYIDLGEKSTSITINGYFYSNSYYVFELIYNGKVIGGGRH